MTDCESECWLRGNDGACICSDDDDRTGPERVRDAIRRDRGGYWAPTKPVLFSREDDDE